MQSQTKGEMFSIIHEYHNLLGKVGLKAAPEKTFFLLKIGETFRTRHLI